MGFACAKIKTRGLREVESHTITRGVSRLIIHLEIKKYTSQEVYFLSASGYIESPKKCEPKMWCE